ncbi:hypothetical protein TNCV_4809951 [Trichonephila clavipes]|uniref:Uncharacterized protein n=1 Tax=Trichonephila clavipes TaxID=2585209 RepID=A0A8X6V8Q8_TRICX|nr:hypothetical protein TNCV_4809951 [Trichonephila clavipes]
MRRDSKECCDDFESDSGSETHIIIPRQKLRVISDNSDDDEVTTTTSDGVISDEFLSLGSIFSDESNSFSEVQVLRPGGRRCKMFGEETDMILRLFTANVKE